MAIWQCRLIVAPRSAIFARYGGVPPSLAEAEAERGEWWESVPPPPELEKWLAEILPSAESWSPSIRIWGEKHSDAIIASYNEVTGKLEELVLYVDARRISDALVEEFCALGKRLDALLLTQASTVLDPAVQGVKAAILRSRARAFVEAPEQTLKNLPGGQEDLN